MRNSSWERARSEGTAGLWTREANLMQTNYNTELEQANSKSVVLFFSGIQGSQRVSTKVVSVRLQRNGWASSTSSAINAPQACGATTRDHWQGLPGNVGRQLVTIGKDYPGIWGDNP
eukprot:g5704.t1